jgi:hypothetical protein
MVEHSADCDFHCDQYWWECTCGAEPRGKISAFKWISLLLGSSFKVHDVRPPLQMPDDDGNQDA